MNTYRFTFNLPTVLTYLTCLGGGLQDPLHCPLSFLRCPLPGDLHFLSF